MSHSVTITRTTTTTSGNIFVVNGNYLGTRSGLLKLAQLLVGAACVGLVAYYYTNYPASYTLTAELFFLLIAVSFLIGTFCLLVSCVFSLSTGAIISKTSYEVVYHGLAFLLYLAASITLMVEINNYKKSTSSKRYDAMLAASIMGLILAALYLLSTLLANRSYRGI